jgi:hypothetical protein
MGSSFPADIGPTRAPVRRTAALPVILSPWLCLEDRRHRLALAFMPRRKKIGSPRCRRRAVARLIPKGGGLDARTTMGFGLDLRLSLSTGARALCPDGNSSVCQENDGQTQEAEHSRPPVHVAVLSNLAF